ncbi:MAG: hypothetical protein WCI20_11900 [bacterium]
MNTNLNEVSSQAGAQHYLRTPDGSVYGPVDIATLCTWATDARVIPGCVLSEDRENWVPVENYPELRLNWYVQFEDGTTYGPLNLLAIWVLVTEESIPKGVALVEKESGRKVVVNETIYPLLVQECRQVLSVRGRLMGLEISALSLNQKDAIAQLAIRDASLNELRQTLTRVEQQGVAANREIVRLESELASALTQLEKDRLSLAAEHESAVTAGKREREARATLVGAEAELVSSRKSLTAALEQKEKDAEALAQLKVDYDALSRQLHEVQEDLQNRTNEARGKESEIAIQQAETDKRMAMLKSKNTVLEKDLQLANHSVHALTMQLNQTRDSLAKAQKAGRLTEQKLKDEIAAIQTDLNGLMLASRCVKQVFEPSRRDPVDWLGGGVSTPASKEEGDDFESRFAKLTMAEKWVVLQKELQASAEQKELMRRELATVKSRCELLGRDSSIRERESAEKLAQLQKEVKTSAELLTQTMQELEKRESLLREVRKKAGGQGAVRSDNPVVMDAEVIHSVTLGPEATARPDGPPDIRAGERGSESSKPEADRLLSSVENQLRRELKQWENLKRHKGNKNGTLGKWFRWKSS